MAIHYANNPFIMQLLIIFLLNKSQWIHCDLHNGWITDTCALYKCFAHATLTHGSNKGYKTYVCLRLNTPPIVTPPAALEPVVLYQETHNMSSCCPWPAHELITLWKWCRSAHRKHIQTLAFLFGWMHHSTSRISCYQGRTWNFIMSHNSAT